MQRLLGVWFCNNYYAAIANSGSVRTLVYFFLICSSPSTDKSSILQPRSIHAVQRPVYNFAELWSRKNLKACRHLLWTDTRWFTKMVEHSQVTRHNQPSPIQKKFMCQETKVTIYNQETAFKLFCIYRTFAGEKSCRIHVIWKNI